MNFFILSFRASVSAVSMWRVQPVTDVNLCTGTSLLTLLMDAPVRYTLNTTTCAYTVPQNHCSTISNACDFSLTYRL